MSAAALYARAFARSYTDLVSIQNPNTALLATDVKAKVTAHGSTDLVGAVEASTFAVLVLAADLAAASYTPQPGDLVTMRGAKFKVESVDGHTRSEAGAPLAYQLDVRA